MIGDDRSFALGLWRLGERIMARIGRPQERALVLSEGEREELGRLARSRSAAHGLVRRAHIILASAEGEPNTVIAERLGVSNPTICHWRKKYFDQGIAGRDGGSDQASAGFDCVASVGGREFLRAASKRVSTTLGETGLTR